MSASHGVTVNVVRHEWIYCDFSRNVFIVLIFLYSDESFYEQFCYQTPPSSLTHFQFSVLVFDDGFGYNLKNLSEITYLEAITKEDLNLTFYYHPCGNTKTLPPLTPAAVSNECSEGYSLCMYNKTGNNFVLLGSQANMHFKKDGDTMRILFSEKARESSVSLECVSNSKTSVLYAPPDTKDQYVSILRYLRREVNFTIFFILEFVLVQQGGMSSRYRSEATPWLLCQSVHCSADSSLLLSLLWNSSQLFLYWSKGVRVDSKLRFLV